MFKVLLIIPTKDGFIFYLFKILSKPFIFFVSLRVTVIHICITRFPNFFQKKYLQNMNTFKEQLKCLMCDPWCNFLIVIRTWVVLRSSNGIILVLWMHEYKLYLHLAKIYTWSFLMVQLTLWVKKIGYLSIDIFVLNNYMCIGLDKLIVQKLVSEHKVIIHAELSKICKYFQITFHKIIYYWPKCKMAMKI